MTSKRLVMELGMGVDLQGDDYTKAACRAVHNALRQNSLTIADAFGQSRSNMRIEAVIGVGEPAKVDVNAVAAVFPYGSVDVRVEQGGLDMPRQGGATILANAAIIVSLDLVGGEGA